MATLEELRAWARGERVEGFPDPSPRKKVDKPSARVAVDPITGPWRYRINTEGDDALLLFGKFMGSRVSQMIGVARQKRYLKWILRGDFPDDLKEVIRYHLNPGPK